MTYNQVIGQNIANTISLQTGTVNKRFENTAFTNLISSIVHFKKKTNEIIAATTYDIINHIMTTSVSRKL